MVVLAIVLGLLAFLALYSATRSALILSASASSSSSEPKRSISSSSAASAAGAASAGLKTRFCLEFIKKNPNTLYLLDFGEPFVKVGEFSSRSRT
jgi:hypothetical protein